MTALPTVLRTAAFEASTAFRNRRAIVTTLLFAVIGAAVMYLTIRLFAELEEQVVTLLGLPAAATPGEVSMTLWRSEQFKRIVSHMLGGGLVFNDILGQHPVVLAFAGFVFQAVPVLTLLSAAPSAAGAIRSGSVRYTLLRITRTEWTLGLFLAEAAVLLEAMILLALAAGAVAFWMLPNATAAALLPSLLGWSLRAWLYSIAWLGVFTGVSLAVTTPGKATILSIILMVALSCAGFAIGEYAPWADFLRPQGFRDLLWRSSPSALFEGITGSLSVAFLYLGLGGVAFSRRDV